MCDEHTHLENELYFKTHAQINRRQFVSGMLGVGLMMYLPVNANAQAVTQSYVTIKTPDGEADAYFVHPAEGKHPAVLIWPDILGLRPAFEMMGKRLAESGYAVLVVNPYYRTQKAPVVGVGASFDDPDTRKTVMALAQTLSPETNVTDAKAFVEFLDKQKAVDTRKKIGTTGYCMGGPMVMRTAAAIPERIGAAASFHGGGLATDADNSPHLLIPKMKARFLIAVAENDDQRDPKAKETLASSFAEAGLKAEIEVYKGALHGWCPPDSRVYNEAQAERAWSRLLVTLEEALA